jgi:hypothetical protein
MFKNVFFFYLKASRLSNVRNSRYHVLNSRLKVTRFCGQKRSFIFCNRGTQQPFIYTRQLHRTLETEETHDNPQYGNRG